MQSDLNVALISFAAMDVTPFFVISSASAAEYTGASIAYAHASNVKLHAAVN
jgi:hypothetical protein